MLTRTLCVVTALALLLSAADAQEKDVKLSDLIPADSWARTGILKLNNAERVQLRDEILAFLGRYIRSLSDGVAVIAPSVSTSLKAREIRTQAGLREIPFRHAKRILVVVRSALFNPLRNTYDFVGELKRDADQQLNIAGPKFHVYVYSMDDDLRVVQLSHESFDAD